MVGRVTQIVDRNRDQRGSTELTQEKENEKRKRKREKKRKPVW
jgi:hypothetical protein